MERVVTYFQHESILAHMERTNKRLWILCLILVIALLGTNGAWIYYESQWQYTQESTQIEADQQGEINVIGGGDVIYGAESKDKQNHEIEKTQNGWK